MAMLSLPKACPLLLSHANHFPLRFCLLREASQIGNESQAVCTKLILLSLKSIESQSLTSTGVWSHSWTLQFSDTLCYRSQRLGSQNQPLPPPITPMPQLFSLKLDPVIITNIKAFILDLEKEEAMSYLYLALKIICVSIHMEEEP